MKRRKFRFCLAIAALLVGVTANAYTITYSAPGVVRAIGGLDVGGTLYNVDFDQAAGYVTYSGDNKFWDGDTAGASAGRDAITDVLNGIGATGVDNLTGARHHTRIEGPLEFPTVLFALGTLTASTWTNDGLSNATSPVSSYTAWSLTPVPVPGAAWLFGSALGLLGWMRSRKP